MRISAVLAVLRWVISRVFGLFVKYIKPDVKAFIFYMEQSKLNYM